MPLLNDLPIHPQIFEFHILTVFNFICDSMAFRQCVAIREKETGNGHQQTFKEAFNFKILKINDEGKQSENA